MASKKATMIIAGAIASVIGGVIVWWMKKPEERVETVAAQKIFPDEILPEQMESDMDELATTLVGGIRERYYGLCNRVQEDLRWDTIPWFRREDFDFAGYRKNVEFMMMGMSFVVHTINRIRKGENRNEFEECIKESADIAIGAAGRVEETHPALKARKVQNSVRELIELIAECRITKEREVAV